MLLAAGIPAHLALLNVGTPVRRDLPSLDQFNHMIVCIPGAGENVYLDCTAKSFDLSGGSSVFAGRDVLVLDGEKSHFKIIPRHPTNASRVHITRSIELTNQTDGLVQEIAVFHGLHAGYYREYFRNLPVANRRMQAAGQFVGGVGELTDFTIDGLEHPSQPLVLKCVYELRGVFHRFDNEIALSPPINLERSLLIQPSVESRTAPFEIPVPLKVQGTIEVRTPRDFRSKADGDQSRPTMNDFISCQSARKSSGSAWTVTYDLYVPAGRFPAARYPAHLRAMQEALESLSSRQVFVRSMN